MIEQLTEQEYSFYLAHGVTNNDDLQLQELLDVFTSECSLDVDTGYHEPY